MYGISCYKANHDQNPELSAIDPTNSASKIV